MAVFVLIPVFNRLAMTRQVIDCLKNQILDEIIQTVVIDDGSTDGTAEYLASQSAVTTLKGDGGLWWGGCMNLGINFVNTHACNRDWILFINNDTFFENDFVQALIDLARFNYPAAVGSLVYDESNSLDSIGAKIHPWKLKTWDILNELNVNLEVSTPELFEVDVLSGRGTLYPVEAIRRAGGMRSRIAPHYYADYELSVRVKSRGYRLLVSPKAKTVSLSEPGSRKPSKSFFFNRFSKGSPGYLPAYLAFWWSASTPFERITLIPRAILLFMMGCIKR